TGWPSVTLPRSVSEMKTLRYGWLRSAMVSTGAPTPTRSPISTCFATTTPAKGAVRIVFPRRISACCNAARACASCARAAATSCSRMATVWRFASATASPARACSTTAAAALIWTCAASRCARAASRWASAAFTAARAVSSCCADTAPSRYSASSRCRSDSALARFVSATCTLASAARRLARPASNAAAADSICARAWVSSASTEARARASAASAWAGRVCAAITAARACATCASTSAASSSATTCPARTCAPSRTSSFMTRPAILGAPSPFVAPIVPGQLLPRGLEIQIRLPDIEFDHLTLLNLCGLQLLQPLPRFIDAILRQSAIRHVQGGGQRHAPRAGELWSGAESAGVRVVEGARQAEIEPRSAFCQLDPRLRRRLPRADLGKLRTGLQRLGDQPVQRGLHHAYYKRVRRRK